MCSICGIIDYCNKAGDVEILERMGSEMRRRGPDSEGEYTTFDCGGKVFVGLQHNRLAVMDPENGQQPMSAVHDGIKYTLIYNGEIYNTPELTVEIVKRLGYSPLTTKCDTEVLLWAYIVFGGEVVEHLNGIFAFAVYSEAASNDSAYAPRLFLARDRLGVKPLYYAETEQGEILFASEIKALLCHPSVSRTVDKYGFWQLFYLTPVILPGTSVFRDIKEIEPGCSAYADCRPDSHKKLMIKKYWHLCAKENHDSRDEADHHLFELLCDTVRRQTVSDVPLCVFLSGGLDSSVISALAAKIYKEKGIPLSSYSFEYEGNAESFHKTFFQPERDELYAEYLADWLGCHHNILVSPTEKVASCLRDAVIARDFPGQADIDSSLLYYCSQVKKNHTVALSGECSDEIFGGYPWFYNSNMLYRSFFPWIHDPYARIELVRPELSGIVEGMNWLTDEYKKSFGECEYLENDDHDMIVSRRATFLSTRYFMTNLLERKDRMSMYSALEVRVPFSDHRIIEYVYNLPWSYKYDPEEYPECPEKALLRRACRDILPEKILRRKKSPYPKTHNPAYESLVRQMLTERLARSGDVLGGLIDREKLTSVMYENDFTWSGQLMSRAQLLAWLYQIDVWFEEYGIDLKL